MLLLKKDNMSGPAAASNIVFGCKRPTDQPEDHVADLFALQENDYTALVLDLVGRKEPKSTSLPDFMTQDPNYRHGVPSNNKSADGIVDDAKVLIYAPPPSSSSIKTNNPKRAAADPGAGKHRHYKWPQVSQSVHTQCFQLRFHSNILCVVLPLCSAGNWTLKGIDPCSTVFGRANGNQVVTSTNSSAGVAEALVTSCEDNDGSGEPIVSGATQHVFGVSTKAGDSSTASCLSYPPQPDDLSGDDLGKSTTPGYRNVVTERAFGCPSIRTDIKRYSRSSVADCQNYGDEDQAANLLKPTLFSSLGLDIAELSKPRSKNFLLGLVKSIGLECGNDGEFDLVFESIRDKNEQASIYSLRPWLEETLLNKCPAD